MIAAVECVSRYVVAKAVKRHDTVTVARFLIEDMIMKYKPFRELLSDNASDFVSETLQALAKMLQAKQSHPVPYRPSMMGLIERFNKTWKDMVSMYVEVQQKDWDKWLSAAAYAYNTSVQTSTKIEPSRLMYGHVLLSPGLLLRRQ